MSLSTLRFSFSNSSGLVARVDFVFEDLDTLFPGVAFGTEGTEETPDDTTGALSAELVDVIGKTDEIDELAEVAAVEVQTDRDTGVGRKG